MAKSIEASDLLGYILISLPLREFTRKPSSLLMGFNILKMLEKSRIIVLIAGPILIGLTTWFGFNFSPGSYNKTPMFDFRASEQQVIAGVKKIKVLNPSFVPPAAYQMTDGKMNADDKWYHFFLYYGKERKVMNCWIRGYERGLTKVALVSVMDRNGNWLSLENCTNNEQGAIRKQFKVTFVGQLHGLLND